MDVSDDGAVAIVSTIASVSLIRYDGTTASVINLDLPRYLKLGQPTSAYATYVAISDDGTRAFVTTDNPDYALGVIDTTVATPTITWVNTGVTLDRVVSSAGGRYAYATGSQNGVYRLDTVTGDLAVLIGYGHIYTVSDDGTRLAAWADSTDVTFVVLPASLF